MFQTIRNDFKTMTLLTIPLILLIIISLAYAGTDYRDKLIGVNGGSLSAPGAKLEIPAGALSEETLITMTIHSDDVSTIHFTFGPHGTVFNTPVELQLSWSSLQDVTSADLILYYYDDSQGQWVEETSAVWDDNGKKAILSLEHFSEYYYTRR